MQTTMNQLKNQIGTDSILLSTLKNAKDQNQFSEILTKFASEKGFCLDAKSMIVETSFPISTNFVTEEILDANPAYSEILGCTDNSNFTAQRPSACLSC